MPAVHLTTTAQAFGADPEDAGYLDALNRVNCTIYGCSVEEVGIKALRAEQVSWLTLLDLVLKYGPLVRNIINDIVVALRSTGGLTWEMVQQWISLYGPPVQEMVRAILDALKLPLPTK